MHIKSWFSIYNNPSLWRLLKLLLIMLSGLLLGLKEEHVKWYVEFFYLNISTISQLMTIDELLSLTWFKRAVDILLSPFLFVRFLIRLISSNFCWKVISSPVLRGGEGRRATTWLTLPDAMVKVDEVPWTFPALDDALVNGGATGRGGGTGSRWSPSELDEPLMLGCRDIVAYFHLALSHKSFYFDFINNYSSD